MSLVLSTMLRFVHRTFFCGPRRQPTVHEVIEARVWICPTCHSGWFADGDGKRRIWYPID